MRRIVNAVVVLICLSISLPFCTNAQTDTSDKITTIFLVRHAEKVKSKDKDPELDEKGQKRAQLLASMLADSEIDVIYSTNYIRTRNTAGPLAELLNKEVMIYSPGDKEFINNLLLEHSGKKILITGHSNTTPALVNQLIGDNKYEQLDESEYRKLFVVTLNGSNSSVTILNY